MALGLGLVWAVVAAVATNMGLGMLWYGKLFAKPWMAAMGMDDLTEEDKEAMQKEAMPGYGVSMAGAALATVLLWFLYGWSQAAMPDAYNAPMKGLVLGFTAWLGFYVAPTLATTWFEERDRTVWAIGAGYWGVLALVYGVYVGVFFQM